MSPRGTSRRKAVTSPGLAAGWNAGMAVAEGSYFLILNADAWLTEGSLDRLVAFADEHPEAALVGPRLLNPDGSLQRSVRGFPTLWRLATEYFFLRKLAPRSQLLNGFYAGRRCGSCNRCWSRIGRERAGESALNGGRSGTCSRL